MDRSSKPLQELEVFWRLQSPRRSLSSSPSIYTCTIVASMCMLKAVKRFQAVRPRACKTPPALDRRPHGVILGYARLPLPPPPTSLARASRAAHDDMRHVLGLQDAPAQCPATDGSAGQLASQRRYRRATCGQQNSRLERAARDLRCRVCWGDGAGSMGRAARPCARHTRYLTFTHTDSPVFVVDDRHEDGQHGGMSRRDTMRPSTPLGGPNDLPQAHSGRARSL